jgi:hypothetical protein
VFQTDPYTTRNQCKLPCSLGSANSGSREAEVLTRGAVGRLAGVNERLASRNDYFALPHASPSIIYQQVLIPKTWHTSWVTPIQ